MYKRISQLRKFTNNSFTKIEYYLLIVQMSN